MLKHFCTKIANTEIWFISFNAKSIYWGVFTLYAMHFNVCLRDQLKFWHNLSNKPSVPLCKLEIKVVC